MPDHKDEFHFERDADPQHEVNISATEDGRLEIEVSQESPEGFYDHCTIRIESAAAEQLRDYLNRHFPIKRGGA
jgi:hypothetical protein